MKSCTEKLSEMPHLISSPQLGGLSWCSNMVHDYIHYRYKFDFKLGMSYFHFFTPVMRQNG